MIKLLSSQQSDGKRICEQTIGISDKRLEYEARVCAEDDAVNIKVDSLHSGSNSMQLIHVSGKYLGKNNMKFDEQITFDHETIAKIKSALNRYETCLKSELRQANCYLPKNLDEDIQTEKQIIINFQEMKDGTFQVEDIKVTPLFSRKRRSTNPQECKKLGVICHGRTEVTAKPILKTSFTSYSFKVQRSLLKLFGRKIKTSLNKKLKIKNIKASKIFIHTNMFNKYLRNRRSIKN